MRLEGVRVGSSATRVRYGSATLFNLMSIWLTRVYIHIYIYMYVSVRECVQIALRTWIDSVEYYGLLNAGQRQHTNRVVTEGRPAPHTRPPAAQSMPMHRRIIQSCTEHFVVAIKATRLMITIAKRNKIV